MWVCVRFSLVVYACRGRFSLTVTLVMGNQEVVSHRDVMLKLKLIVFVYACKLIIHIHIIYRRVIIILV